MSFKIIELHNNTLKVFEDGKVFVKRCNRDEFYEKKLFKTKNGYFQLPLFYKGKSKKYYIHRLVSFCFLELDIENPVQVIDHKDRDKSNNVVSNLRIVTNQQNLFNTNAKGYSWHKHSKKWRAYITVDGKTIHLGYFDNEEDAKKSYQDVKPIHHIIN